MKRMKNILGLLLVLLLSSTTVTAQSDIKIYLRNQLQNFSTKPYIQQGVTMVGMREIFEALQANVDWNAEERSITAVRGDQEIKLYIDRRQAYINQLPHEMAAAPTIRGNKTYVPLRFISEVFGERVEWNNQNKVIHIGRIFTTEAQSTTVKVGQKKVKIQLVKVDLTNPKIKLKVALGKNQVGQVEALAEMAKKNYAKVAINGTFFDAYTDNKKPYGVLISEGKIGHLGTKKTVFGFGRDNKVDFRVINPKIEGAIDGSYSYPNNWWGYGINSLPNKDGSSVYIYTREQGDQVGFDYGTNVVVEKGIIKEIKEGNMSIPENGFVINLLGAERDRLLNRFVVGKSVEYRVQLAADTEQEAFWQQVQGAVGAGPRLVTDGKVTVRATEEGFLENKILTASGARSCVGVTKDNVLLFATTPNATLNQLAEALVKLGAEQAMNLDGGASSGLYYDGKYLTTPGRQISNTILVIAE